MYTNISPGQPSSKAAGPNGLNHVPCKGETGDLRDDQWPLLDKRRYQPKLLAINGGDLNYQDCPVALKDKPTASAQAK